MRFPKLPRLRALGNKIVDAEARKPLRLRGVNRSGLEYARSSESGFLANVGITDREFDHIAAWGGNVVRIPFNQARVLDIPCLEDNPYVQAIDQVIAMSAVRGSYTLLDLQWIDSETPRGHLSNGEGNFVPPLPNLGSLEAWSLLAQRYAEETAVLYDLFNEPHDPLPDDAGELNGIGPDGKMFALARRQVRFEDWTGWAAQMVKIIRRWCPGALIFVSGIDWGYDLEGFPSSDLPEVVYSAHVYPNKKKRWDSAFGALSQKAPVFIGEFGGTDQHVRWGRKLLEYLDERELGWAAWSWSDHPHLLKAGRYEPTLFGELVLGNLRKDVRSTLA